MPLNESAGQSFKIQDSGSYDPVAQLFDLLSDRFAAGKADRLLALARLRGAERGLDEPARDAAQSASWFARVRDGGWTT